MTDIAQQHKNRLRDYFDGIGFQRWSAIYGSEQLSLVRRSIRAGHAAMLALAEDWVAELLGERPPTTDHRPPTTDHRTTEPDARRSSVAGRPSSVLDAGCGTGLFSLALARRGFDVTAVDIAPRMVDATRQQARAAGLHTRIACRVGDLESLDGSYDAVACLDVLVHYPQPGFEQIVRRLAQISRGPLLLTYAPREPLLAALHWVGGRFPRGQRRTDIQMIPSAAVQRALESAGMQLRRQARVSRGFYHIHLVEAHHRSPLSPAWERGRG